MDKFSVLVICAIVSVFFVASTSAVVTAIAPGCCGFTSGFGGYAVFAPPSVKIECHATSRDDHRADPSFTGYGYQASGCPNVPQCGVLTCDPLRSSAATQGTNANSFVIFSPNSETYNTACAAGSGAGTYTRTWCGSACASNGNAARCAGVQTIQVRDTTPPVLSVPGTANLECGLNQYTPNTERVESGFVHYYDQCTAQNNIGIAITDSSPGNLCGSAFTPIITRQYVATDACNLRTTDTQTINIVDTTPPILRGVFDETVEFGTSAVSNPVAEDLCDNAPTIAASTFRYNGRCSAEFTTERVYIVSDACGNTRRYSSILTTQDTLAPTCLEGLGPGGSPVTSQDINVLCTAYPPAVPVFTCTDVGGAVTLTRDDYETFQVLDPDNDESREALDRTLIRNFTATDPCGNTLNWVYRYHIQQVSTITYVTGTSVTILPGKTGLVTFQFNLANCFLRGARLHYDVYPLVLTGGNVGTSAECREPTGRQVVGDSYCRIVNPGALPALLSYTVEVYVPLTFEQDKLTVRFELSALNQLDQSGGTYGEVIIHTA